MEQQVHWGLHSEAAWDVPLLRGQFEALQGQSMVELVRRGLAVP
jgi:hypothetical protein